MASEGLHEPAELLSEKSKDLHRAIVSLMEELEAIDWYQQRAEATQDPTLRAVLEHNRNEEAEHAMMVLEWLRRNNPLFDVNIRTYLMKEGDITTIEEREKAALEGAPSDRADSGSARSSSPGSLGVGSLKAAFVAAAKEEG